MAKKLVKVIENKAERIINEYHYGLDLAQQKFLEQSSGSGSKGLLAITRECFKDPDLDEHSEEFAKVKNYLVKIGREKQAYNFSEEEIEFIIENGPAMKPMDIARGLFPDAQGPLAKESQTIAQLCEAMDCTFREMGQKKDSAEGDYQPPRTVGNIVELINRADSTAKYHISQMNIDPRKKECVIALKRNMCAPRFVMVANSLTRQKLRDFFEVEFARAAYNKPDLTVDETNQYISLCKAYVDEIILFEIISSLNDRLNEVVLDDEKKAKLHVSITEALETKTQEAKALRTFITSLQKILGVTRAQRMKDLTEMNQSLAKFVQLAQEEKGRELYLRMQKAQIEEIEGESKKIKSYSDLIGEIYGVQIGEIINF